jgi:putative chitinase
MKFNHTTFFTDYKKEFNVKITNDQVAGIEALLNFIESDAAIADVRWIAYIMATVKHECADKWKPIEEYSDGKQYEGRHDLGNVNPGDGPLFKGRGFVQITGRGNYRQFGKRLSVDLEGNPKLALDLAISYKIASLGMRQGLFTGVGLLHYIHEGICDYKNSRRIINGTDRAELIQGYADKLEKVLRASQVS